MTTLIIELGKQIAIKEEGKDSYLFNAPGIFDLDADTLKVLRVGSSAGVEHPHLLTVSPFAGSGIKQDAVVADCLDAVILSCYPQRKIFRRRFNAVICMEPEHMNSAMIIRTLKHLGAVKVWYKQA